MSENRFLVNKRKYDFNSYRKNEQKLAPQRDDPYLHKPIRNASESKRGNCEINAQTQTKPNNSSRQGPQTNFGDLSEKEK